MDIIKTTNESDDDMPLFEMKNKYKSKSKLRQSIIIIDGKIVVTKDKMETKKTN